MTHDAVARRYATALYDLATEHGLVDDVLASLDRLIAVARLTPELPDELSGAACTPDEKKRLLDAALRGAPGLLLDFFGVVVDKHRARHATQMALAFRELVERERNVVVAEVRSAVALTRAETEAVQQRLAALLKATVRLVVSVDRGILGGLVIQAGDKQIDVSLRTRLTRLKAQVAGMAR